MAKITGGDKIGPALQKIAKRLAKAHTLEVGFLESAVYPDGTSVAMVAAIQEYGAPGAGIPPRPFFRTMIAARQSEWAPRLTAALKANGGDAEVALGLLGQTIKEELQASIMATDSPPLSPVTLLLRQRFWSNPGDITFADVQRARADIARGVVPTVAAGQTHPLMQTHHLIDSVTETVK